MSGNATVRNGFWLHDTVFGREAGRTRRGAAFALIATTMVALAPAGASAADALAGADGPAEPRYQLVHGCYSLRSLATGQLVGRQGDGSYSATRTNPAEAEGFRLQATALGQYLLYDRETGYLAATGGGPKRAATPSPAADLTVADAGDGAFTLTSQEERRLTVGDGGALALTGSGDAAAPTRFTFEPADGCAVFPEAETNATGTPSVGSTSYTETRGFLDAHMHLMGFEFLGGKAHCGRPWHPYGITFALNECEDGPVGNQATSGVELALGGGTPLDDPKGWPNFKSWPSAGLLAHEGSYYKWLERAWRGGLRTYVNLYVENHALCEVFPLKKNSCNEMDSVRLQVKRLRELENYIDAQEGGPGKGWFRIVGDPFEARRVMNAGKLAVVPGIEVSTLFDCGIDASGRTPCTNEDIDRRLNAAYDMGVRDMELTNKFDNGFGGVAGDNGSQGVIVNSGNKLETGSYWRMQTCTKGNTDTEHDRLQETAPTPVASFVAGTPLSGLAAAGVTPSYPPGPHCNTRGLTEQGAHLVRRMMEKGMIIDPDHLSVASRETLLDIVEQRKYSGVVSSHSWGTREAYGRIEKLGGVVTPIAGSSAESFVEAWKEVKAVSDPSRRFFGFGYGADQNGFAHQPEPRNGPNPVQYPFKSFDGAVTLDRNHAGTRTWDINVDGVAQYGLYPDFIEDLRHVAGDQIVEDMSKGPEAYLQMWERAVGVWDPGCRNTRLRFTGKGIALMRLRDTAEDMLRGAGQPLERKGRVYGYCVKGSAGGGRLRSVFDPAGRATLLVSTAPVHRALGVGHGSKASRIRKGRRFGKGLIVRNAGGGRRFVYGVRGGRVRFAGVATGAAAKTPKSLREALKLAGLRV